MFDNIKKYDIILASNSPRRKELLGGLGLDFTVRVMPDIDETYPEESLPVEQIAAYLAEKKALINAEVMKDNELIITADTIVIAENEVLGKPVDEADAVRMLQSLSGRTHQVITGVCLFAKEKHRVFSVSTDVTFKTLTQEEIGYYVSTYKPMDKAGAYGIQEWIGYIGVTELRGSYFNVMGLPVQRIYKELSGF